MVLLRHAILILLAILLLGCAPSGGSRSSASSATTGSTGSSGNTGTLGNTGNLGTGTVGNTGTGTAGNTGNPVQTIPGSQTNLPQWQTAMAALAQSASPDPLTFEAPAVAAYNAMIHDAWPLLRARLETEVEAQLIQSLGTALNGVALVSVTAVQLDAAALPSLYTSPPGPIQTAELRLPEAPGSWSLSFDAQVGGSFPISIGGSTQMITLQAPVSVVVSGVRIELPVNLDLTPASGPVIQSIGNPLIAMQLTVSSSNPLLSGLTGLLSQLLDPIIRGALTVASIIAPSQLGTVQAMMPNSAHWGLGGPGLAPMASGPDLESLANTLADQIQADHMHPDFNMVVPSVFSQPVSGGSVTAFRHHGDSACWTGAYLAAEAYRYDFNADPRALIAAQRLVSGFEICSQVVPAPHTGLLARFAVPLSSPHAALITGNDAYFTGSINGQTYGALGDTSRDAYTGTILGLGQAWYRIPSLRPAIQPIFERLLSYLEAHSWTVYKAPGQANNPSGDGIAVTFIQDPQGIVAFAAIARMIDPVRWGALHQSVSELSSLLWFPAWASAMEVHEGYYKFNLGFMNLLTQLELETDPDRYRDGLKVLRVLRATVGHHQNPWFDAIQGVLVPTQAPAMGADVTLEFRHWAQRPRRGFTASNSTDPSIQKVIYTASLPNATGSPSSGVVTGPRSQEVAVYPLPIEKRVSTAFLWTASPFELDGWVDPHEQHPGIDLVLPYWLGRNHGVLQ